MSFRRLALFLVVVALFGCNNEKNRNLIDSRVEKTEAIAKEAATPATPKSYNPLTVSDKVWSGNSSTRLRRGIPLPSKYEGSYGVTLISSEVLSLSDIASAIGVQTGLPVRIASGAAGGLSSGDSGTGAMEGKMTVSYEGPLSGLLDLVSGNFGVSWRYDGSAIKLSRFETRVFVVETLPGTQSTKDGLKEDTGSGGSSSSSSAAGGSYSMSANNPLQQSSEMSVEMKVWDELSQTISSILGGVGSVSLSPSSGTAVVTTTPELMQVVAKFMEEENLRLSQQIAINVEIYTVALADNTDFNVAFTAALKKISRDFAVNITQGVSGLGSAAASDGASMSMAILDPSKSGHITSVFSALSSVGDATRVSQFPLTTLNNRTVSRRIGEDRTYVAAISKTVGTATTSESITVTPGTVRDGFSMQLTPRLLQDGRVMLQYSLSLVDVLDMVDFPTGDAGTIQLPKTASRVFVQQAMLKSGSTLILGGIDDEKTEQRSNGVGNAYNYFLGGGSTNSKTRTMMFIVITPQVVSVPKTEQL
ncbi:MAG: secretin N-terminal domain-containing protein [Bdellovibrionales bacterium]|jgi:type IVB pilus formation R64 PilN family outer membrane protein